MQVPEEFQGEPEDDSGQPLWMTAWITVLVVAFVLIVAYAVRDDPIAQFTLAAAGLLGLIPATIAERKGYSFLGFWAFGALLFIVALPVALSLKPIAGPDRKKCPWCAELILAEARVCRYCGRDVSS